ncbi:MAG: cupredoxin domain-containing protein [Bdellovibrionales bacterium]
MKKIEVKNVNRHLLVVFTMLFFCSLAWSFEIDLSRRRKKVEKQEVAQPVNQVKTAEPRQVLTNLFSSTSDEPKQEIVVLNTEKGFVPAKLAMRKGVRYQIHVVNVNTKEKNVSFIMDAFSEHHSTYYGVIKTFEVKPAQEGVYSFYCPETSYEGKVVVIGSEPQRFLSSDEQK